VLAVVAAAAIGLALALALTGSPGQQTASAGQQAAASGRNPSPATSHAASPPASPTATPTGTSAAGTARTRSGPSGAASANGGGALPAGYYRFTNPTRFSIGVPDGWQVSHQGHYVYLSDPSDSNVYLLIDQSDHPKPNPLADWEQQQANRKASYPGYRLISLRSVNYPQAEAAADWEFTYVRKGVPVHILNRNIRANQSHAYALYWSTTESDWNADYHYFQAFAATFRPAPAKAGRSG
jgi:hypothetical protein